MRFCVLSSGSKANATFIECGETRLLIDCGLSARQLVYRLSTIGVAPQSLSGIIVTHEHSDHVFGLETFTKRFKMPVYMNALTWQGYDQLTKGAHIRKSETFVTSQEFQIGNLSVKPFSISHDAADPVGFRISGNSRTFAYCTDLGRVTPVVEEHLHALDAVVLESNHDEDLLRACHYPWELKQRILSNEGHLSNHCAGNLLRSILHNDLKVITLGHLSEHSNRPDVALSTVRSYLPEIVAKAVSCASIAQPTKLFDLNEADEVSIDQELSRAVSF